MERFIKYIKQYRINSIFAKNFIVSFCVILLPICLVNILIFNYYISSSLEKSKAFADNELSFVQKNIDRVFEWIDSNCDHMLNDVYISSFLLNGVTNESIYENILIANVVQNQLQRINFSDLYIDAVHLYSVNADYIISTGGAGKPATFYDTSLKDSINNKSDEIDHTFNRNGRQIIRIQKALNVHGVDAGIIFLDIDYEVLKSYVVENISDTNCIQIYRNDDEILLKLGEENASKHSISRFSENTGFTYFSTYNNTFNIIPLMIIIFIISFIFVLLAAIFLTYKACNPISNIIDIMDNADSWGIQDKKHMLAGEAKYILENFLDKTYYSKSVENSLKERAEELKVSQIEAINLQIKPHFLYNTLQLLSMSARKLTNSSNETTTGIEMLSDILQYSLNSNSFLDTIENEVAFTKAYVSIQKLKYNGRINVTFKVDENILTNKTAKIVIQPLIENSYTHGILPYKETGEIFVQVYGENNRLIIEVIDNGAGISPENQKKIKEYLKNGGKDGKHIGLANINRKIKLMFGEEYGLRIDSDYMDGSRIIIEQPLE